MNHFQPDEFWLKPASPFGKPLRAALVFPDHYRLAASNLGFQIVFDVIQNHLDWSCERFVLDSPERSLETGMELSGFDAVFVCLSFEGNYIDLVRLLQRMNWPIRRSDRNATSPPLILGGIAISANPFPLADLADFVIIGEAEAALPSFLSQLAKSLLCPTNVFNRAVFAGLPGVFVPDLNGTAELPVDWARTPDLKGSSHHSAWITPDTEFSHTVLVEVARGCPNSCRFCMVRQAQQPLRFSPRPEIIQRLDPLRAQLTQAGLPTRVGLLGAAVATHPDFLQLCRELRERGWELNASALEIDKTSEELVRLLVHSQKTLTIAPERPDENQRFQLGKKITDAQLFDLVEIASRSGVRRLKLYFMTGLVDNAMPGEERSIKQYIEQESTQISGFVETIAARFRKHNPAGQVLVTCSPFVPKAHTPWQGRPCGDEKTLRALAKSLTKALGRIPGVSYQSNPTQETLLQAVLSQSGSEVLPLIEKLASEPDNTRRLVREYIKTSFPALHQQRWEDHPPPWQGIRCHRKGDNRSYSSRNLT